MAAKNDKTFLMNLIHDLKTPLRAQNVVTGLLVNKHFGDLSDKQMYILNELLNSNVFMLNMVEGFLSKYRDNTNKIILFKINFDLAVLINECINMLEYLAKEKNITIETNLSEIIINADYQYFKRVILNLLTNSINYNRLNGKIIITTKELKQTIKIIIEDTGLGMSEEKQKKYFESNKCDKNYNGLGINIIKEIIKAHNGKISIKSKVNKGTVISINIPKK